MPATRPLDRCPHRSPAPVVARRSGSFVAAPRRRPAPPCRDLTGLHEVADLATLTAMQDCADLAATLGDRHAAAIDCLGRIAEATVATTRA